MTAGAGNVVLQELEAGQPDFVERDVVGAAKALIRYDRHAEVAERRHPRGELSTRVLVALQHDAAVLPRAVILIEVRRELLVGRLGAHGGIARVAEVLLYVRPRAEQSLFFAGPERHANGASRLRAHRFQDAHGFERHGHARRVVAGVRAGVPGVEVRADHHDFVLEVAAGDLAHEVHRLLYLVTNAIAHLDFDLYRDAAGENAIHPVVVLGRDGHDGRRREHAGARPAIGARARPRKAAHGTEPAAFALQHGGDAFGRVERDLLLGREQVGMAGHPRGRDARGRDHRTLTRVEIVLREARYAVGEWCEVDDRRRRDEHRLAFQRAAILLEIGLHQQVDDHRRRHLSALRAARVRHRIAHHRLVIGLEQVDRHVLVVPRHAEVHERLSGHVHEANGLHLPLHPRLRARHVLRQGESRAEDVGDVPLVLHDL